MARLISARNVVHMRRAKQDVRYTDRLLAHKLRVWRDKLADGRLTPDMLTSEERIQLQTWILEHPKERA
jgi:hypothetical protein